MPPSDVKPYKRKNSLSLLVFSPFSYPFLFLFFSCFLTLYSPLFLFAFLKPHSRCSLSPRLLILGTPLAVYRAPTPRTRALLSKQRVRLRVTTIVARLRKASDPPALDPTRKQTRIRRSSPDYTKSPSHPNHPLDVPGIFIHLATLPRPSLSVDSWARLLKGGHCHAPCAPGTFPIYQTTRTFPDSPNHPTVKFPTTRRSHLADRWFTLPPIQIPTH